METKQVMRTAHALAELVENGMHVQSIKTEMVPDPEDPDFLDPIVVIKYIRKYEYEDEAEEHEVKVYWDGSMSDF